MSVNSRQFCRPRLALSACLLGENVRYDGGHKHVPVISERLAAHMDLIPVCPEVELGLGVPREPIQLVQDQTGTRLLSVSGGRDLTASMVSLGAKKLATFVAEDIDGLILKSRSPSCGIHDTPRHNDQSEQIGETGAGLFAQSMIDSSHFALIDENDLSDEKARHLFLSRIFLLAQLRHMDGGEDDAAYCHEALSLIQTTLGYDRPVSERDTAKHRALALTPLDTADFWRVCQMNPNLNLYPKSLQDYSG